jgi:hypothetical protein
MGLSRGFSESHSSDFRPRRQQAGPDGPDDQPVAATAAPGEVRRNRPGTDFTKLHFGRKLFKATNFGQISTQKQQI